MSTKHTENGIARRVAAAVRESGQDTHIVARAADITSTELNDRLNGRADFTLDELVHVGGFLRITIPTLFKEAA